MKIIQLEIYNIYIVNWKTFDEKLSYYAIETYFWCTTVT